MKNTLAKRAAEEAGASNLLELFEGPTAIAFLESDGDPVPTAIVGLFTAPLRDLVGVLDARVKQLESEDQ